MASTPLSSSHEHHIVPSTTYFATLVALGALMLLTVWAATINLPAIGPLSGTVVNQAVALIIAVMKAYLVVTIFMGVRWTTPLAKLWSMVGFVWLSLMFIILVDYGSRKYEPVTGWEKEASAGLAREIHDNTPDPLENKNSANLRPRF